MNIDLTPAPLTLAERAAITLHDAECGCGAYDPAQEPEGKYMRDARVVVDAARPHIAAEALRKAARELAVEVAEASVAIPNRLRAVPVDRLMARSREIEGGAS